jgi:hypothetical protein
LKTKLWQFTLGVLAAGLLTGCGSGSSETRNGGFTEEMLKSKVFAMDFYTDQLTLGEAFGSHVVFLKNDGNIDVLNNAAMIAWQEGFTWQLTYSP